MAGRKAKLPEIKACQGLGVERNNTLAGMQTSDRKKSAEMAKMRADLATACANVEQYRRREDKAREAVNKRNDVIRNMMVDRESLAEQYVKLKENRDRIAHKLTEMRITIKKRDEEIQELEAQADGLKRKTEFTEKDRDQILKRAELLRKAKLSMESELQQVLDKTDSLEEKAKDLESELGRRDEQIKSLKYENWKVTTQLEHSTSELRDTCSKLKSAERRIAELETKDPSTDSDIGRIEQELQALSGEVNLISSKVDQLPQLVEKAIAQRVGNQLQTFQENMLANMERILAARGLGTQTPTDTVQTSQSDGRSCETPMGVEETGISETEEIVGKNADQKPRWHPIF